MHTDIIERLTKLFMRFPGIGTRQARRFAYFIMTQQMSYVETLASTMLSTRRQARTCTKCLCIFDTIQEDHSGLCSICVNSERDASTIAVVEKSQDIEAFMKTEYKGLFFVLGALIPIVQKNVLEGTHITMLQSRIQNESDTIQEVILAFPLTPNGDHTDQVVREILSPGIPSSIRITSLGRGLSAGTELEYADPISLSASLKKRE